MGEYNPIGLAIPLFLFFMVAEYLFLRAQGRTLHRYNDSVASLSMGLCLLVSDALLKAYTFAVFIWLYSNFRVFDFQSNQLITWLIFFLGVDFCYYWFHRVAHEVNFLWGAHVGHHQSEEFNLTTALRQSAFQYAFSWVFYLPLAVLGCPPEVFLIQFVLLKAYQFWIHTQAINKIPLIEGIFSTPSSHRVHHAKNPIYIDKNYGGTLVIWDRMFGTWQEELKEQPCHYGTTEPLKTLNPVKANLQHWSMLAKDAVKTNRWRDKIQLWFKPTGWRPEDQLQTEPDYPGLQKTGTADREKYNPETTPAKAAYVAASMIATLGVASLFLLFSPQLAAWQAATGAILLITGVVITAELLENRAKFLAIELIRVPALIWFGTTLL